MQDLINAYLVALAQCVKEEVAKNGETCFSGLTVGDSFISMSGVDDDCDDACGEAWVRVIQMYPSTSTGVAETRSINCSVGLGIDIEIGALRCFEMSAEAPTAEKLLTANVGSMNDAAAIYRAIACCDHFPDIVVGTWTPLGPEGGLVGGVWTLSASLV